MKIALPFLCAVMLGFAIGCISSHQQVTFNTLYSVEHTTVTAYDAFVGQVIAGNIPTNGIPRVSRSFNTFQSSFLVALDAAQFNTNALAPESLMVESRDVINLITTVSH